MDAVDLWEKKAIIASCGFLVVAKKLQGARLLQTFVVRVEDMIRGIVGGGDREAFQWRQLLPSLVRYPPGGRAVVMVAQNSAKFQRWEGDGNRVLAQERHRHGTAVTGCDATKSIMRGTSRIGENSKALGEAGNAPAMHRRGSRMGQPNPTNPTQNSTDPTKPHNTLHRFTIVHIIPQNSAKFCEVSQNFTNFPGSESSETTQECISLRLQGGNPNSQHDGLEELLFMHARHTFRRWRARKFDARMAGV